MPRRVALPGADELFRSTGSVQRPADDEPDAAQLPLAGTATAVDVVERPAVAAPQPASSARPSGPRRPSGRQRHEEKITVYVSPSELVDLEHARLILRAEHSLAVDRGRIVREALAVVLADLESKGEQSILVRRLRGR
ncbi:MAG TPA: cobyrinic acid a,c-diamide synthase [Mycobacteriales bacterium]|nr:cobyrinic acid a,c-diamide synthase [Mycobacteriales bacterium]